MISKNYEYIVLNNQGESVMDLESIKLGIEICVISILLILQFLLC